MASNFADTTHWITCRSANKKNTVALKRKRNISPLTPMQFVGIIDAVKDLRNLHCDAEPKNIQGEKVKLPQIAKSMDQSSHFRWLSFDAFLDRVNNMERTYRKPDRVQRNATEE
jgi:hypothetical protein